MLSLTEMLEVSGMIRNSGTTQQTCRYARQLMTLLITEANGLNTDYFWGFSCFEGVGREVQRDGRSDAG
jgi:hypothetical protein